MSMTVLSTTRIATAAAGAPVNPIARAPTMIVRCSTISRPYGANIWVAAEVRRYSPRPTKLNQYDTPWLR